MQLLYWLSQHVFAPEKHSHGMSQCLWPLESAQNWHVGGANGLSRQFYRLGNHDTRGDMCLGAPPMTDAWIESCSLATHPGPIVHRGRDAIEMARHSPSRAPIPPVTYSSAFFSAPTLRILPSTLAYAATRRPEPTAKCPTRSTR
jgi:hypothetical protein